MKLSLSCVTLIAALTAASAAVIKVEHSRAHNSELTFSWTKFTKKHLVSVHKPKPVWEHLDNLTGTSGSVRSADLETAGPKQDFGCGVTRQTTETSQRGSICPASCPLFVQDKTDKYFCSFRCVEDSIAACQKWNPKTPVADNSIGVCRGCKVSGCHDCALDGTDTCVKCKTGFSLSSSGQCWDYSKFVWYALFLIAGLIVLFVGFWLHSLWKRPATNEEGLERAKRARNSAKLHQPQQDPNAPPEEWPWNTNLLTTPVAGNGVLHLFNFQFLIIAWGSATLLAWYVLAYAVDTDFLRLGVRSPGETPRDNCIIIAWGFTTQQRLMYAKYMFVLLLYISSFVAAIVYAIVHLRRHQILDTERVSHKDFCAKLTGLPSFSGTERLEDTLKDLMEDFLSEKDAGEKETEAKVIGVSVCWDYGEKEELLMKVIENDYEDRMNSQWSANRKKAADERKSSLEDMSHWDWMFAKWENVILSPTTQRIVKKQHGAAALTKSSMARRHKDEKATQKELGVEPDPESNEVDEEVDVIEELNNLHTTDEAFVVFATEALRDAAIEKVMDKGGIPFHQSTLHLEEVICEPQTVQWPQLTVRTWSELIVRCVVGFLCIVLALVVWVFCFYLPYARSVVKSDYAHGTDPDALAKTMFGFIVIAGNAMMYIVCAEVSDKVGFKTQARREVCYMLLYCFACTFNVILDLVMAYQMAYRQMVGAGAKTHEGEPLGDVDSFAGRFEAYAMQKSLGQILLDYSFPSTFLIPFLVEPFVVVIGPYVLMSLVVRTNPAIVGTAAESYLSSSPMDLSRYADVLLNLMLAVLMFFFPGGYLTTIMWGLVISHIVIYAWDHYRVLRSIPACDFATREVDWWAQLLLSVPCGLLLSCAAFKANCAEDSLHCWKDAPLIYWCLGLLIGHIIVHTLVMVYVVPLFGHATPVPSQEPYRTCAVEYPCSWFAANPVHCLRSQYIYEHDPPCDYYILGRDHWLRYNENLHLYFQARSPREGDEFDAAEKLASNVSGKMLDVGASFRSSFKRLSDRVGTPPPKDNAEDSSTGPKGNVSEVSAPKKRSGAES